MDRLYDKAIAFIEHYNLQMDCNLKVIKSSDKGFSLPYISSDTIHIDKSIFLWIAFYHFGDNKIFTFYRVLKLMLDLNFTEEAENFFNHFKKEFEASSERFSFLLSQNPEWIPSQLMVLIMHEVGHHVFKHAPESMIEDLEECLTYLNNISSYLSPNFPQIFDKTKIPAEILEIFNSLKEKAPDSYENEISEVIEDADYLEELVVDKFVFNEITNSCINYEFILVNYLALFASCMWFIEYANRVNNIFAICENENNKIRLMNKSNHTLKQTIRGRLRALFQDYLIYNIFINLPIKDEFKNLYNILVGVPYENLNNSFDPEFWSSLEGYQKILNKGCQIDYDEDKHRAITQEVEKFENEIFTMILSFIKGKEISQKEKMNNYLLQFFNSPSRS